MSQSSISITRYHDISCGHTVYGHESKCRNLHGHNYRFWFTVEPLPDTGLDSVGRVIDFSVLKSKLADWLEENWDHKFLIWNQDPRLPYLSQIDDTIVPCTFNPTAENIANCFLIAVAPVLLYGSGTWLKECRVEETRKCSATAYLTTEIEYQPLVRVESEGIDDLPF